MEEILASIRKIISDEDVRPEPAKPPAPKAVPTPAPPVSEPPASEPQGQDDIDALLAGFDEAEAAASRTAEDAAGRPDILELTEAMAAPAVFSPDDIAFPEPTAAKPAEATPPPEEPAMFVAQNVRAAPPAPAPAPATAEDRLLSSATDTAISAAFGKLTHTILSQNARTLDDLVQDMLRPMLKSWLDDNLPPLVERLVRAEIERVSRGGR